MGPFKGIDFKDFLNHWKEWHAITEGFADEFCIRACRYEPAEDPEHDDKNLKAHIREEHHYYNAGRVFGFAALITLLTGMGVWVITSIS